eukprot:scaffold775_cov274-Pinguiococcus_pyrenoidosus.AAC.4
MSLHTPSCKCGEVGSYTDLRKGAVRFGSTRPSETPMRSDVARGSSPSGIRQPGITGVEVWPQRFARSHRS